MKNSALSKGSFLIFLAALFWSINAPIVRFVQADPMLITGVRALVAGVVLLPLLRPKKLNWSFWTIVYLVSYCALCISVVLALSMTSSVIAIGMQYTSILWLFLANYIMTRTIDHKILPSIIVIFTGVILFMTSQTDGAGVTGNLIAMTEGISFALMSVSAKKSAGDNPSGLTAIANLFTAGFVFLFFPTSLSGIGAVTNIEWLSLIILGVVQIGAGYICYNKGLKSTSPQQASIIALWEMVLGPVWIAMFFKEYPSLQVIIGLVLVIGGIILNAKRATVTKVEPSLES